MGLDSTRLENGNEGLVTVPQRLLDDVRRRDWVFGSMSHDSLTTYRVRNDVSTLKSKEWGSDLILNLR